MNLQQELIVDLRSDTVTQPTGQMYERMNSCKLGDDGLEGDPTAIELEETVASLLGKEAGIYVPSATMANLLAVMCQTSRQGVVAMESNSHIFKAERRGATLAGTVYHGIEGAAGAMDVNKLEDSLKGGDRLQVDLVCMENTHNNAGGTVLSLAHMAEVYRLASKRGVPVHLDGARMFNAAVALGVEPIALTRQVDTISVCLSKGLSAPMGAVLVGSNEFVKQARQLRKVLGGTQRQIGIAAAAGIVAINEMRTRLSDDHRRAALLATGLRKIAILGISEPQTNIVQVDISRTGRTAAEWISSLERLGVQVRATSEKLLRCVTHRHIDDERVEKAVQVFAEIASDVA